MYVLMAVVVVVCVCECLNGCGGGVCVLMGW